MSGAGSPVLENARLRGAYYRARVLMKDRGEIEPALRLLGELSRQSSSPSGTEVELQIARLHAQALIRSGDERGRWLMLRLLADVGGAAADAGRTEREHARFLDDLCSDLTAVGAHDEAIEIADRLAARRASPALKAVRLGNLAAWLLQRAVARRAEIDRTGASDDLGAAANVVAGALELHMRASVPKPPDATLHEREARAVALSIAVERSALEDVDLSSSMAGLRDLLRASLPVPRIDTHLQVGYRIGRLGVAHVRSARRLDEPQRQRAIVRGRSYLQLAWASSGNACIRPWLALDLLEAHHATADEEASTRLAEEALRRLTIQCGGEYPVVTRIRMAVGSGQ